MKYVFGLLALLAFLSLPIAQAQDLAIGSKAPDFTLNKVGGGQVSLSQFSGKPVLLVFWTTWCPTCREEIPLLKRAYEEYKSKGLTLLSIDVGENERKVASFARKQKIPYAILLDQNKNVTRSYKVKGIPKVLLLDIKGNIKYNDFGLPVGYQVLLNKLIKKG
ncbi:MAG: TlpA family protein disulfide reductase [Armatimonadetes bacterium]|nr:TlpA family protein disulfide reductase [Armatimonadota bacterium]